MGDVKPGTVLKTTFAYDAWVTAAVASELRATVVGGRVQEVVQPDEHSVALEVYAHHQRRYFVLSAHPERARVHLVSRKPRRGLLTPTPLLLALRKWARGARLDEVSQPPFERVLRFTLDHPEHGVSYLVAEVMGRHSNILLLGPDDRIVQAVKVVGPDRNPVRTTRPGDPYVPPPAQDKASPLDVTEVALQRWLAEVPSHQPVWRVLVSRVQGVSPLFAREITFRACGDPLCPAGDVSSDQVAALHRALAALLAILATEAWQPCIVREGDRVLAFAPYPLTHLGRPESVPSMSAAIEAWLESAGQADPYAGQRERVRRLLAEARTRAEAELRALEEQLAGAQDPEQWKRMADWLLAYAAQVPAGAGEVTLETDTGPLTVPLDPQLSPVENAQQYYRKYRKARRALQEIPARLEEVRSRLDFLAQLETDLQLAQDASEIGEVEQALIDAGLVPRPRKRVPPPPARPLTFTTPEGFTVLVGKSARLNDEITFRRARPNDLWFHARNVPGAHVVLRCGGRPVSEETRRRVAALAAYYSAARDEQAVDVQVARVRDVRRHPSGRPGMVLLRREEVMRVTPQPWEEP